MNSYEQARRIEIKARRLALAALAGEYRSAFRGSGLDFDEVRPYTPGDDIRSINWQVTARMGQPYIKRYVEERQLTLLLLVDVSGSTAFGSGREKRDLAVEITAVLAAAAMFNQDRAGLILFSNRIEALAPPGQGRQHTQRLIHTLLTTNPTGQGTNVDLALQTAERVLKQRGVILLISDFLAPPEAYQPRLARLNRRHDVRTIWLGDPWEQSLPNLGLVALHDAETGEKIWLDTADPAWQATFAARRTAHHTAVHHALRRAQTPCLTLSTADDWLPSLARFLALRQQD